jgi:hypothetical protein
LILLLWVTALSGQDAAEIVRRSLGRDPVPARAKDYTYTETSIERSFDKQGKGKETKREVSEVFFAYGEQFERVISRNGKPVTASEEEKQQRKLASEVEKQRKKMESAKDPSAFDKRQLRQRELAKEVPKAFDFHILREEAYQGRPVWVIDAKPKAGYRPPNDQAKLLTKIRGTLWVDKSEYQWVKADVDFFEAATLGLFVVKLLPGAKVEIRQRWVNGEVWLPEYVRIRFDAKLAGIKMIRMENENRYSDFKRYSVDVKEARGSL